MYTKTFNSLSRSLAHKHLYWTRTKNVRNIEAHIFSAANPLTTFSNWIDFYPIYGCNVSIVWVHLFQLLYTSIATARCSPNSIEKHFLRTHTHTRASQPFQLCLETITLSFFFLQCVCMCCFGKIYKYFLTFTTYMYLTIKRASNSDDDHETGSCCCELREWKSVP